jgi:protein TonB
VRYQSALDERPELIRPTFPRYPDALRVQGIEGWALVEFVVDTSGHVDQASVTVVATTDPLLGATSSDAVASSLFRPARVWGRAVRVRVLQPVNFKIAGDP